MSHFLRMSTYRYSNKCTVVRNQVLTAACTTMTVCWDVASCSLVANELMRLIALTMEAVGTSETSVNFYSHYTAHPRRQSSSNVLPVTENNALLEGSVDCISQQTLP
jgi:hypothetical protein